ncbi:MAG: gas vesicle protein [Methanotrichaceae archaeon]|nr:gas vesicle protein [Methanotrichaceae archaeon]
MKPERESCLVEVLDRLLNKGAVLNADLIISVAGVPMIGLNLRAALASMETMLEYGMMEAWDKSTRDWYALHEIRPPLDVGEKSFFKAFGYLWQDQGIVSSWLPGIWHITTKRLFLWRRTPGSVIFEVPLHNICILKEVPSDERFDKERFELEITYSEGTARIYLSNMDEFKDALESASNSIRMIEALS